jgi:hypothetical protein
MCRPGAIGHDVDFDFLVLASVIFQHVVALLSARFISCGSFWLTWMATRCGLVLAARALVAKAIETSALVAK